MPLRRLRVSTAPARLGAVGVGSLLLLIASELSDYVNTSRGFNPWALVQLCCFAASMALFFAFTMDRPVGSAFWLRLRPRWRQAARVVGTLALWLSALLAALLCFGFLYLVLFHTPEQSYLNDVISFNAANAQAVLNGHNPYTDNANFIPTLIRFHEAPPTPIQGAIFGSGYNYPYQPHVFAIEKAYLRNPSAYAGAFDPATLHSYPALSFLLFVPLVALGQNILLLHMLAYGAVIAWLVMLAPKDQRLWVGLAAATVAIPMRTLILDTEILCAVFVLVAWRYRENRWIATIALGLGCAFKQYCWFFAPFLLLDAYLRYGWREALRRGALTLLVFLVPNLPFILMDGHAWLASVLLPLNGQLFPQGIGLVSLSLARILPHWPLLFYAVAESVALVAALYLFFRFRKELSESALLLSLSPIVFAYRSPANYFAIVPWLTLFAMLMLNRRRSASVDTLDNSQTALSAR